MIKINDTTVSSINVALRKIWYKICCLVKRIEVLEEGGGQSLQEVVNVENTISNFGGIGDASIQSTNFTSGRTLYLNDDAVPTIKIVDNANASNYLQIDLNTLNIDGTSYNWSSIVNPPIGTWGALNYPTWSSGTPFVKMTAAGNFALDTNDYVPTSRTLTINGTTQDLSADRSFTVSGSNIYNSDGSLTAARTLTLNSQPLTIAGTTSSRFFANGNVGIGTTTDAGYKLDVFGPVRLYPRGTLNGGFEFTNIMHSNSYTYLSSNNAMYIGGVGITLIGTNKNDSQSQLGLGYQSWQTNLMSGSAKFDIRSTTQGFLMPRMTTVERNAIATPATGLQIYNTTTNTLDVYNGSAWSSEPLVVTNRQTANYTLVIGDIGKLVETNVATANTLTVPLNSSVAFPIGSKIDVAQYGVGQTTITAAGGVTINSNAGALKIATQYSAATLVKIATNEWYCFGNLAI